MCGLFGVVALDRPLPHAAALREARDTLVHRGPDQAGEWANERVWMGHRRLSILDLSENGRQPMVDPSGQVAISVNGEIYNFKALRRMLEASGARFRSESDSEVILHGYMHWGIDRLLERIDGMYAIALVDLNQGKLYLARDRAGIKPLFYARHGGLFSWASEPSALLTLHAGDPPRRDPLGLYDFLTYRYIPSPRSAWRNVSKLPPAHLLTLSLDNGDSQIRRYWTLEADPLPAGPDTEEELRSLIAQSVTEQRIADVPLGLFLSGGVDSGIIAAECVADGTPLNSFTIGFEGTAADETRRAALSASHLGVQNTVRMLKPDPELSLPDWLLDIYQEPFGDESALPTWHVAALARQHVTVALSGDGGDELFGGYRWYRNLETEGRVFRLLSRLGLRMPPSATGRLATLARVLEAADKDPLIPGLVNAIYISRSSPQVLAGWRQLLEIPADYDALWYFKSAWRPELGLRRALQYLDFHCFLPEDVLTKVDRATMAHSLEARVPFLSRKLIEFSFRLPETFVYRDGQLKAGLKQAYRKELPAEIFDGPKRGFGLPTEFRGLAASGGLTGLQDLLLHRFMEGR